MTQPTKIFFYKLLHVLLLVEHPQLDADVRALVELMDEGVDGLRHPGGGHNSIINLRSQHFICSLLTPILLGWAHN